MPPEVAGHTRLYLSGPRADEVRLLFSRSALDARIAEGPLYAASAVKMAYAAWTKGSSALLLAARALARAGGVERTLLAEWALSQPSLATSPSAPPRRRPPRAGAGSPRWRRSPRPWPPPASRRASTRPPPTSTTAPSQADAPATRRPAPPEEPAVHPGQQSSPP